jgi:Phosphotransferase enzyme family
LVSADQNAHETYRVIVLDRTGSQVLMVQNGQHHILPWVELPRWQRVAEKLTVEVANEWGEEVLGLFELPANNDGPRYLAAEHLCTRCDPKMPTHWVRADPLTQNLLLESRDYAAIEEVTKLCRGEIEWTFAGPFARLGWFDELRTWIDSVIEPTGLHLTGEFRQLNASPTFSLVRFETDGSALWFKAVGEPNLREFAITSGLGQLFPQYLPPILATRPDWNGWLSSEVKGKLLSEVQEQERWERTAAALAGLQIESIDRCSQILCAGARDLGSAVLSKLIQPFLSVVTRLMEGQTKVPPPVLDRKDLLALAGFLQSGLNALDATGIPETLGHLDLNPGNIVVSESGCAFLDWAETYVGHPLFSLEYLLEHARRTFGLDSAIQRKLTEAYCRQWNGVISPSAIKDGLVLAPLLAVFAYAVGSDAWNVAEKLEQSATAAYFRSLVRRMHREATELTHRSAVVS